MNIHFEYCNLNSWVKGGIWYERLYAKTSPGPFISFLGGCSRQHNKVQETIIEGGNIKPHPADTTK